MRLNAVILLALSSALPLLAADWPQLRGPNNDGISPEKGINKDWKGKPPKELWKIELGDNGFAGPSVADGKLFIVDHQGKQDIVRAVDLKTGKDVWTFKYDEADNNNYGFARSTPTFDNGKLYTFSREGRLHCLDAASGNKVWMRDLKADFKGKAGQWGYAASPLVDGNKLIVCPGGAKAVVALDKLTGKTLWAGGGSDQAGYATPVIATLHGKRQCLVFSGTKLISVDPESGAEISSCAWKTSYEVNAGAPVPVGDAVFVSSGYGKGCGLVSGREVLWQNKEIQEHFSSAVFVDGFLYSTSDPDALVCLDPKTGKSVWRQKGFEKGGLVAVDGALIVADGRNGEVALVKAQSGGYEELGRIKPLGGQSWTAPIVADGKLIVRNTKALICLDLK